ncbi:transcriptional repressor LexA [Lysobacter sp. CFH 32150]|uniref:transcriptional repressor LexA n=1 Tax=Lysobacter sp. CFH 32150 TaxID=2927128 RepID=UPI001FA7137F|nr:transcriptional repressor LexA [Lysobacter sp. CFH 32150]MCI4566528.1 transcriptional repressor LexA [Lysobacter sp. CFH 32150]
MPDLTDRQQAILDFVRERIAADGLPPTWAEIAREFGFRQTRAAQKHLQALAAKGYLTLLPGKARGIRLPGSSSGQSVRAAQIELPILGRVAAGAPIGADVGIERHLLIDPAMFSPKPDYLLRVQGDSMRDDGILDGDLVAVHRTTQARDGQVVVARVDGEVTIKRLQLQRDRIRLLARNPDYAPIEICRGQDFAIEGLYCGLIREA